MADLSQLPKIHPREKKVNEARYIISRAVQECISTLDISYGELFSVLSMEIANWAKYCIRDERGNHD
jgi:hypothetical protein